MKLRKMRLSRAWSQEQVAEMTGLSVRTVQRIERGQTASLDSLKALAAVFDVNVNEIQNQSTVENANMDANLKVNIKNTLNEEEALNVVEYVKELKGFYSHLTNYVIVISVLFVINFFTYPQYVWAVWPALGWGVGLLSHAASVFEWFSWFNADWEKKQVEKRLGRKL